MCGFWYIQFFDRFCPYCFAEDCASTISLLDRLDDISGACRNNAGSHDSSL